MMTVRLPLTTFKTLTDLVEQSATETNASNVFNTTGK
jgi:hypothetical protein